MKNQKNSTRKNSASNNATINRLKKEVNQETKEETKAIAISENMKKVIEASAKKQTIKRAKKTTEKKEVEKKKSTAGLYYYHKITEDLKIDNQVDVIKYLAKYPELNERVIERSKAKNEYAINIKKIESMKRVIKAEALKTEKGKKSATVHAFTCTHHFKVVIGNEVSFLRVTMNTQNIKDFLKLYKVQPTPEASKKFQLS